MSFPVTFFVIFLHVCPKSVLNLRIFFYFYIEHGKPRFGNLIFDFQLLSIKPGNENESSHFIHHYFEKNEYINNDNIIDIILEIWYSKQPFPHLLILTVLFYNWIIWITDKDKDTLLLAVVKSVIKGCVFLVLVVKTPCEDWNLRIL